MVKIGIDREKPFALGTRVKLSALGHKRCSRSWKSGTVVGYASVNGVRVLFDGRKTPIALHASYLELAKRKEAAPAGT